MTSEIHLEGPIQICTAAQSKEKKTIKGVGGGGAGGAVSAVVWIEGVEK